MAKHAALSPTQHAVTQGRAPFGMTPAPVPGVAVKRPLPAGLVSAQLARLSLREKVLIWIVVILALVVGLVLLLLVPAQDRLYSAREQLGSLQTQKEVAQLTIATAAANQQRLDEAQERYEEYLLKYQAPLLPEDLDRMITTLVGDCGFTAISLTLHPLATETVAPYSAQASTEELPQAASGGSNAPSSSSNSPAGTASSTTTGTTTGATMGTPSSHTTGTASGVTGTASNTTTDSVTSATVQVYAVELTVKGPEESYFLFLDRIVPLTWLKVLSTSYTPSAAHHDNYYSGYYAEEQAYTFSLKVYVNVSASIKQP